MYTYIYIHVQYIYTYAVYNEKDTPLSAGRSCACAEGHAFAARHLAPGGPTETRVVTNPIGGGQHLMFVIHRLLDFGMINKMILSKFRNFLIDDKPWKQW